MWRLLLNFPVVFDILHGVESQDNWPNRTDGLTDIIFANDGNNVVLKVGSQEASKALTGNIKATQAGIVLGRSMMLGELFLDGSIANLRIYMYDYISQDIATSLTTI